VKKLLTILLIGIAFSCIKEEPAPAAIADFTVTGDKNFAPLKVTFLSTSTNASVDIYDFGDGVTTDYPPNATVTHVYATAKVYSVTMKSRNEDGVPSAPISKSVTVLPPPTKMTITSVVADALPLVRTDGSAWDSGSGPDPYFKISDTTGTNYFTSGYYPDVVTADFPLTYNVTAGFPQTLTALDYTYTLEFWDHNTVTDSKMASVNFAVRNYMPTDGSLYPPSIKFAETSFSYTLNISWQ
jgi:PKD repeat protein